MHELARRQFDRLERDHWWFRGRRTVYVGLLRHLLGGARPARALDLGAGRGAFASELRELCGSVVALDLDAQGLATCRGAGRASAVLADSGRLPFADHSFDLVCLFDVLEHLDDDCGALREVRRVLRPGGLCFASVPAWPWLFSGNDRLAHHKRRYTRGALERCARSAGLEIVRNTHTNVFLFPLIAPAVLARKAWEALRGARARPWTNLSWSLPSGLGEVCFRVFAAELAVSRWVDLPIGHSIAIAARCTEREQWRCDGAWNVVPGATMAFPARPSTREGLLEPSGEELRPGPNHPPTGRSLDLEPQQGAKAPNGSCCVERQSPCAPHPAARSPGNPLSSPHSPTSTRPSTQILDAPPRPTC